MTTYPTSTKEWLAKLVGFDTNCLKPSNLNLIHYVKAYLESVGIASTLVYNPEKTKANLWATLPGEGGVTQGGIILSGHSDVVPVAGQKWDSDPFQMVEKNGKWYGRGTMDMKAFLAISLALVPTFLKMKRAKPIHFAFSFDEEIGCAGVGYLIEYLKQQGFKADCCLIGEPTNMTVGTGCKGFCEWKVTVKGKAIHSSMALMNTSCNAIEYAAMILTKIREIAIELREKGPRNNDYGCPFCPISTGIIKGGNAVNTVPAECEFMFSVRLVDSSVAQKVEDAVRAYVNEAVLPAMRAEYPEADVTIEKGIRYPAYNADENAPFTKEVRRMCNDYKIRKSAGGNEGGHFVEGLGIPTVVVGPGGEGAHEANEYVTIASVEKSTRFTLDLVTKYTAAASPSSHL